MSAFACIETPFPEFSEKVQHKLFQLGYGWGAGKSKGVKHKDSPFLFIWEDLSICYGSIRDVKTPLLSYSDFIETAEKCKPVTIELNDEYYAVITTQGIDVGCQKFSFETLDKLVEASKNFR